MTVTYKREGEGPFTIWYYEFDGFEMARWTHYEVVDDERPVWEMVIAHRDADEWRHLYNIHESVRTGFWSSRDETCGYASLDSLGRGIGYIVGPADNRITLHDDTVLNYPPFYVKIDTSFSPAGLVCSKGGELAYWLCGDGELGETHEEDDDGDEAYQA